VKDATRFITLSQKPKDLIISLKGSKNSPLFNPAIYVKNWNLSGAKVLVNNKEIEGCQRGDKPRP
jgi:hypothetical protein